MVAGMQPASWEMLQLPAHLSVTVYFNSVWIELDGLLEQVRCSAINLTKGTR